MISDFYFWRKKLENVEQIFWYSISKLFVETLFYKWPWVPNFYEILLTPPPF